VSNLSHRPSGKYYMEDVHRIGGIPAILKYLMNHTDLIDGTQLTVTGNTLAQNLEDVAELEFDQQDVVKKLENPIKSTGHLTILRGNLAPGTAVAKITGKEGSRFEVRGESLEDVLRADPGSPQGIARCFDR
jgi:dihydroxy-acid dehydratase